MCPLSRAVRLGFDLPTLVNMFRFINGGLPAVVQSLDLGTTAPWLCRIQLSPLPSHGSLRPLVSSNPTDP